MDLNISLLDILVIWLVSRILDHGLQLLRPNKKSQPQVNVGGQAEVQVNHDPSKWTKTCHNCQQASYTMYAENKCPHCDNDRIQHTDQADALLVREYKARDVLGPFSDASKWLSICPSCHRGSYVMYSEHRCPYCRYEERKAIFDPNRNMCSALVPPRNVCGPTDCVHPL